MSLRIPSVLALVGLAFTVACARPSPPSAPAAQPDEDPSETFDEPSLDEADAEEDPEADEPIEEAPADDEEPLDDDATRTDEGASGRLDDLERALLDLE